MSELLPNQAHFEFEGEGGKGEKQVILNSSEIGMLHSQADDPKAKFDLIIEDMAGNVQLTRRECSNPTGRWGERIDLPVADSYYKIRLENVSNAKSIDIFAD